MMNAGKLVFCFIFAAFMSVVAAVPVWAEKERGGEGLAGSGDKKRPVILINQDGVPVPLAGLKGKALVMTFIYTRCPSPTKCPLIMSRMVKLQRELADYKDKIGFAVITIDPEYDTPKVLKEYAEINGADLSNFVLLTGPEEDMNRVFEHFRIYREEEEPGIISHSLDTFFMDRKGVIEKVFPGAFWDVDTAADTIVSLLRKEEADISSPSYTGGTVRGTVTADGLRTAESTVVYIENVPERYVRVPEKHAVMDQKNLTFIPHILPIVKGTTVDFLNSDSVAHNVFSPDGTAGRMDLGTWQRGDIRNHTFNKIGSANILCHLHPEMSAYILVLQNGYFALADRDGRFTIADVPEGRYTLKVWNEYVKDVPQKEITVKSGEEAKADFIVTRGAK